MMMCACTNEVGQVTSLVALNVRLYPRKPLSIAVTALHGVCMLVTSLTTTPLANCADEQCMHVVRLMLTQISR